MSSLMFQSMRLRTVCDVRSRYGAVSISADQKSCPWRGVCIRLMLGVPRSAKYSYDRFHRNASLGCHSALTRAADWSCELYLSPPCTYWPGSIGLKLASVPPEMGEARYACCCCATVGSWPDGFW